MNIAEQYKQQYRTWPNLWPMVKRAALPVGTAGAVMVAAQEIGELLSAGHYVPAVIILVVACSLATWADSGGMRL